MIVPRFRSRDVDRKVVLWQSDILEDLKWRGAITRNREEGLQVPAEHDLALYCGTDPTPEIHFIGHLIPL